MKNTLIIAALIVILAGVAYTQRHSLKSMFMGQAPTPTVMQQTPSAVVSKSMAAPSDNIYLVKTDATKGQYLTDFDGKTLYVFDKDTAGISTCYDACADAWPFYTSGATAQGQFPANVTVTARKDSSKQFAWKGRPLYYYSGDQKAGDITGDGIGGIWHIVKP